MQNVKIYRMRNCLMKNHYNLNNQLFYASSRKIRDKNE